MYKLLGINAQTLGMILLGVILIFAFRSNKGNKN